MKSFKKKASELGQGTVEYILILLVVVIIAIGALYQLNTAFTNFAQNYFGEYLACLLETGEMPNLGAPRGTTCDSEFEEFSLANGRRKTVQSEGTTPPGEFNNPESSSSGPGERQAVNNEQREVGAPGEIGVSGRGGGGGGRRSRRGRGRRGLGGPTRVTLSAPGENAKTSTQAGKKSSRIVTADGPTGGNSFQGRSFSGSRKGAKRLDRGFSYTSKREVKPPKTVKRDAQDFAKSRGRQSRIVATKKEIKFENEEEESFTFSDFIKYLLIAGIIIAIVIFLGGQLLQFSKGDDG